MDNNIDISKVSIYSSNQLNDDSIVLGTISNGIIHINSDGSYKYSIDFEKGLSNNTVLSVFQDSNYDLWLGLDIGISHVNLSSRFRVYNDNSGQIGTVYTSIVHDGFVSRDKSGLFSSQEIMMGRLILLMEPVDKFGI